ncbi:MAG: tetratricopeptide repeat protein [Desulfobacteraceae bacterium]|nr:tetratricopeptide repeat protein [Desulfobacteraceae bacterium]
MFRRVLLVSFILVVVFSSAGKLLADAANDLKLARTCEKNKDYQQAQGMYETIITNYPATEDSLMAQARIIVLQILADKNKDLQAEIDKLYDDYEGYENLPKCLYDIARRYQWSSKYESANNLYKKVVQEYPDSLHAGLAQSHIPRMNVLSLILSGNDSAAESALKQLISDFPDDPALPEALYAVGNRYAWNRKYEKASDLFEQIVKKYPSSSSARRAGLQAGMVNAFINIKSKNYTAAQDAVNSLVTDYSDDPTLPSALYRIADRYEASRQYQQARDTYQQIIQLYPDSTNASNAQLDVRRLDIQPYAESGDDARILSEINSLIADFPGHSHLPAGVLYIAERFYYLEGFRLHTQGYPDSAEVCFQKATAICELVINQLPDAEVTPSAYICAGSSYRRLGLYEESIQCYQTVVDKHPLYRFAGHAQFRVGRNYEEMSESGLMAVNEAVAMTRDAYENLLEKYPDCKTANIAKKWLSSHNYR